MPNDIINDKVGDLMGSLKDNMSKYITMNEAGETSLVIYSLDKNSAKFLKKKLLKSLDERELTLVGIEIQEEQEESYE